MKFYLEFLRTTIILTTHFYLLISTFYYVLIFHVIQDTLFTFILLEG
jgi:hypothetical protein